MGQLKNRKPIGVALPIEQVDWLKTYSTETDIPVARIIERALNDYKEKLEEGKK